MSATNYAELKGEIALAKTEAMDRVGGEQALSAAEKAIGAASKKLLTLKSKFDKELAT